MKHVIIEGMKKDEILDHITKLKKGQKAMQKDLGEIKDILNQLTRDKRDAGLL